MVTNSFIHSSPPVSQFPIATQRSNQRMHLCSALIVLLFPFLFLNAFSESSNNPSNSITRLSINCGSAAAAAVLNGGEWVGDMRPEVSSQLRMKGSSTASTIIRSSTSADQVHHKTARISASPFSYEFRVTPGEKTLRLHFNPASYKGFQNSNDLFNVEAGSFTLLSNFSASLTAAARGITTLTKEFCLSVEENQELSITFSPALSQPGDKKYAFINGIEIIPIPPRLSFFKGGDLTAHEVGQNALVYIDNRTALELTNRVSIKRDEVDDMLGMWSAFPKATEYGINSLTWKTPVDVGFRYLIRIHLQLLLADSRGVSLKILVNEMIVVDANISKARDEYDILQYRSYVVAVKGRKQEGTRDLLIKLLSYDELIDGHQLIKGFEIFKLSNTDNSLASPNAFPLQRDSPSWTLLLSHSNAYATLAVAILVLINIFVHMLREILEESMTEEEENKPSARAERVCRQFSLAEIQSATKNFSEALLIGRGGFGKVYKGLIDNGRETVAIKRLKSNSTQGRPEFLMEIETLSELRHINLVSLIGYCRDYKEMILVYEYMPNGTLADHLHIYGWKGNDSCSLTWKQRLNICIGAARGLDYLHTGNRVIHRDVKASNILLDGNFIAKVSDFGLAKLEDRSKLQSHISTKVKGTPGYLDPYYYSTRKLTRKSDTYAFGVVLFEVLCERKAKDPLFGEEGYCLITWARNKIKAGDVSQIVASSLMEDILPDSLNIYVEVAERCLHDEPSKRPTMAQVVLQLESALELQESIKNANDVCPSNEDANTEKPAEASTNGHDDASPPTEQTKSFYFPDGEKEGGNPKPYKPLRFLAWDTFWSRLKPSKSKELELTSALREKDISLPTFDFRKIAAATHQFSSSHKIGGGFGSVYKAVLPSGRTVAVKRFRRSSPDCFDDFINEIISVSRLHHRNIIELIGYCIHEEKVLLLYEFMKNGSLDKYLFDEHLRHQLQWSIRFKVIIGIAKGIVYLHGDSRKKTIHRDLKPSNILLDNEMDAIISGFGVARNIDAASSEVCTIVGTFGYIAPEYVQTYRISEKTDVYSFGVTVLEILSGQRNTNYVNFIVKAWKLWIEGKALELVDESLAGAFSEEEALRCIQVGLLCIQCEPQQRPTMPCALKMLHGEEPALEEMMTQAQRPTYQELKSENDSSEIQSSITT